MSSRSTKSRDAPLPDRHYICHAEQPRLARLRAANTARWEGYVSAGHLEAAKAAGGATPDDLELAATTTVLDQLVTAEEFPFVADRSAEKKLLEAPRRERETERNTRERLRKR